REQQSRGSRDRGESGQQRQLHGGVLGAHREQPSEKLAVPSESDAKLFGRGLISPIPLPLESCSLLRELRDHALDDLAHELVSVRNGGARIVHETSLKHV